MFALIFKYVKTAIAFSIISAIMISGVVLSIIFTRETFDLVLRIIGLIAMYLLLSIVVFLFALKLFKEEVNKKGNVELDVNYVITLISKILRHTKMKTIARMLLLERANGKISLFDFKSAELDISDAMAKGLKGDMLNAAHLQYAYLTFFCPDNDRFFKYAADGRQYLQALLTSKNIKADFASMISTELSVLNCIESFVKGDLDGAFKYIDSVIISEATNNITKISIRLIALIMLSRANKELNSQYIDYVRTNAKDTIFEKNLDKILSGEIK